MKCEHLNREILSSNYISSKDNLITIRCKDCGMIRYESRDSKNGSINTGKWFYDRKIK